MSAIVLFRKAAVENGTVSIYEARNVLLLKGFKVITQVEFKDYIALHGNKILSEESYIKDSNRGKFIFLGTPVYKNSKNLAESFEKITNEILNGKIDYSKIRGNYSIVFENNEKQLHLLIDPAGIFNLYFADDYSVISNLFLCTIFSKVGKFELNRFSVIETLLTGRLAGPDTLINGINRIEPGSLNFRWECDIRLLIQEPEYRVPAKQSLDLEVKKQISLIENYFADISDFANHYGVDSGLTGGHDSRIILMMLLKYSTNFSIHSLWRKNEDTELKVARQVALKAKVDLKIIPVVHHFDMTEQALCENLLEAFHFYDGHIRMHCFLNEAYNTSKYRLAVLGDKRLGINGVGGEQYRNEEHIQAGSWSANYFFRYFLGYHIGGRAFEDKKAEEEYFSYFEQKMLSNLAITGKPKYISRESVKKYMSLIYVRSLMGVRTNIENQLSNYLTPFLDYQLLQGSFSAIPHLGISYYFQQEMIRRISKDLAEVNSGYGYDFVHGEPVSNKIKYLIKEVTPAWVYQQQLDKKFRNLKPYDFLFLLDKFKIIRDSISDIRKLKLPLNERCLVARPDLMPVYISMGYFIHYLNTKNKISI